MVNKDTPEERLKKYKERLAEMAQLEEQDSKLPNPTKSEKTVVKREPPPQPIPEDAVIGPRPKPPPVLESPAKRELRESMVVKKKRDALRARLGNNGGKNRIMLKAREKAIDNQLQEIKNRKSMLEREYKRKVINKVEYESRLKLLVNEGQNLLKEKSDIDKELAQ